MAIDVNQIMKLLNDPTVRQLLSSLMGKMGGQQGGQLNGLLEQLSQGGLGQQADSWIGTGQNSPVTGNQMAQALGQDNIDAAAASAGVSPEVAAHDLAEVLPQLVNSATPDGQLPQASDLQQLMSQLMGAAQKPAA
ncbi:YidB family protein [Hamadaea sp.]|uniref:YidB family protein n=1 Tax=Hamadaea sp. TaxID=2024425 RepID=UPI0025C72301|nr:YidB family protein [Hamadaea sp.]